MTPPLTRVPRWTHDCDQCEFVAAIETADGTVDVYLHPAVASDLSPMTIVARYGNEGPEYQSSPNLGMKVGPLWANFTVSP